MITNQTAQGPSLYLGKVQLSRLKNMAGIMKEHENLSIKREDVPWIERFELSPLHAPEGTDAQSEKECFSWVANKNTDVQEGRVFSYESCLP